MQSLSIRIEHSSEHVGLGIAELPSPLDPRIAMILQEELSSRKHAGIRTLILDVGQLRYLSSLGMSALVNIADQLGARGGCLHLAGAQPRVKLILGMMGLDEWFKLHGSISSALRAIEADKSPSPAAAPKAGRMSRR